MTKKKLNILFLSSWYPNRVLPTLGNFVQKHAEAVALHSNVIALFVCSDINCKKKIEITESTINNVLTINVYYKKINNTIPVISNLLKAKCYVQAHLKGLAFIKNNNYAIDLVHLNILYPAGIIAWYLKKTKKIPYIATEHWTGYLSAKKNKLGWVQKTLSKIIASNANVITPVSKDLKDAMINIGFNSKYDIVYNAVDTALFFPLANKRIKNKVKFIHVSTLDDAHKNITGMLEVAAELSRQRIDFEFWFIGDGDFTSHVETAKKLNIYDTFVYFEGTKTTLEIADIMRNADCFVLFSNYENLPCVIIEALASGIPIVSSSVGGIAEHINDDFGVLVPPMDNEALLISLSKMIDNLYLEKYDAQQLRDYANNNFSYIKVSEKFHMIYHQVLAIA